MQGSGVRVCMCAKQGAFKGVTHVGLCAPQLLSVERYSGSQIWLVHLGFPPQLLNDQLLE